MEQETITLELTRAEALVVFEFLARTHRERSLGLEDLAERQALWNLEALLEKALPEPFADDYDAKLEAARKVLRDQG